MDGPTAHRDVVAIGASAGGIEALRQVTAQIPADFPAAVIVALHVSAEGPSALPRILSRAGPLPAVHPQPGERLRAGTIYVAPPGRHLVLRGEHLLLSRGPKENGHRPAVDPLFRSVARWRAQRGIGVVLSGGLDDGAGGLATIVDRGGRAVVQDPATALHAGMPNAALAATGDAAVVVPVEDVAGVLCGLVAEPVPATVEEASHWLVLETEVIEMDDAALAEFQRTRDPVGFTCPECQGPLYDVTLGKFPRFRCRVGHAWSPTSLLDEKGREVEGVLWMAVRALQERSALHRRMAEFAEGRGREHIAEQSRAAERSTDHSAKVLRELLVSDDELHEDG